MRRRLQVARLKLHKRNVRACTPLNKMRETCVKNFGFFLKEACDKNSKLLLRILYNLHVIWHGRHATFDNVDKWIKPIHPSSPRQHSNQFKCTYAIAIYAYGIM
jgi:hypothetical protein